FESGSFKSSKTTPISWWLSRQASASHADPASSTVNPSAPSLSATDHRIRLSSSTTRIGTILGEYLPLCGEIPAGAGMDGWPAAAKTLDFSMSASRCDLSVSNLDPDGTASSVVL